MSITKRFVVLLENKEDFLNFLEIMFNKTNFNHRYSKETIRNYVIDFRNEKFNKIPILFNIYLQSDNQWYISELAYRENEIKENLMTIEKKSLEEFSML